MRTQARTLQQISRPALGAGLAGSPVPVQFGRGRVPARLRGEGRGFAFGSSGPELLAHRTGRGKRLRWDGGGRRGRLFPFQCLCTLHPGHVLHWPVRVRMDWAGAGPGSQERKVVKSRGYNFWLLLESRIIVEKGWVIWGPRRGWLLGLRGDICLTFRMGGKH